MTNIHVEISIEELDALFSALQLAEFIDQEYYTLLMTGRQADYLRPGGSRIVESIRAVVVRAQNTAYEQASDDERLKYAELLAEPLSVPDRRA
jgi:hypothetical protein